MNAPTKAPASQKRIRSHASCVTPYLPQNTMAVPIQYGAAKIIERRAIRLSTHPSYQDRGRLARTAPNVVAIDRKD
jgi:hypothetical protein